MKVVRFEHVGAVGHVVLCDPPDNVMSRRFVDDLGAAVREASVSGCRALILRAEGPDFGSGAAVSEWPGKSIDWFHTYISDMNQAFKAIEALRIPTVAAVRGKAHGGHFEMLLHCDFIVAAETAMFLAPEATTGLIQLVGGLQRLAERIGRWRALEMALLAVPLSGARAGELGLACRVTDAGEVDAVAIRLAEQLASGATLALNAGRALLKAWSAGGVTGADDLLLDLTMPLFQSQDAQASFAQVKQAIENGAGKTESEQGVDVEFAGR